MPLDSSFLKVLLYLQWPFCRIQANIKMENKAFDNYIDPLGFAIARIMGMKNRGEDEKALHFISETLQELLQIDFNFIQNIPDADLITELVNNNNYTLEMIVVVAELLNEQAEITIKMHQEEQGKLAYSKALILFEYIEKTDESLNVDRKHKITRIKQLLNPS